MSQRHVTFIIKLCKFPVKLVWTTWYESGDWGSCRRLVAVLVQWTPVPTSLYFTALWNMCELFLPLSIAKQIFVSKEWLQCTVCRAWHCSPAVFWRGWGLARSYWGMALLTCAGAQVSSLFDYDFHFISINKKERKLYKSIHIWPYYWGGRIRTSMSLSYKV